MITALVARCLLSRNGLLEPGLWETGSGRTTRRGAGDVGWMWNLRQVGMGDRRQKGRLARLAPLPVPVICALCRCAECLTRCLGSRERPFAIRSRVPARHLFRLDRRGSEVAGSSCRPV
ncbi:MAG: hypothetical protein M5U19_12230 [Microthrixaceae bacterium]|nr:hypothetical protein [Microthrixaceae bacterium]